MCFLCGFSYVTGENVDGMAYVIFGVIHQNQKNSFPSSLQRVAVSTFLLFDASLFIILRVDWSVCTVQYVSVGY